VSDRISRPARAHEFPPGVSRILIDDKKFLPRGTNRVRGDGLLKWHLATRHQSSRELLVGECSRQNTTAVAALNIYSLVRRSN
jgi:hypothetical protein